MQVIDLDSSSCWPIQVAAARHKPAQQAQQGPHAGQQLEHDELPAAGGMCLAPIACCFNNLAVFADTCTTCLSPVLWVWAYMFQRCECHMRYPRSHKVDIWVEFVVRLYFSPRLVRGNLSISTFLSTAYCMDLDDVPANCPMRPYSSVK